MKAYQKKVVEWEVERKMGKPKLDEEGGHTSNEKGRHGRRKKKKKKKKNKETETNTIEIGQGK